MPVTIPLNTSNKPLEPLSATLKSRSKSTVDEYIRSVCPNQFQVCKEVLQSSFDPRVGGGSSLEGMMKVRGGSLVDVSVESYNQHHHLVLRPDDIWIAILSQLSFYINAHAEELRHTFVSHEGKKELRVDAPGGNRYTVDFAYMARTMGELLKKNVKDPKLCEWIQAEFSTTTDVDRAIYAIEMMATMKKYFSFAFSLLCGLPSVTLDGSKDDWENILTKLDRLETFGDEPKTFAQMLRTVLSRFVRSFDVFSPNAASPDVDIGEEEKASLVEFWNKIADYHGGGSGPTYLSGWITAFSPWSSEGKWIDPTCAPGVEIPPVKKPQSGEPVLVSFMDKPEDLRKDGRALVLDVNPHQGTSPSAENSKRTMFPIIDTDDIPPGFVEVNVKLDDNGAEFETVMVAGHLGGKVLGGSGGLPTESGDTGEKEMGKGGEMLAVASGWFMFIKDSEKEKQLEQENSARMG